MRSTAIALGLLVLAGSASAEQIRWFAASILLDPDGSFIVTEKISYDFERASRRGIYRDIPVRYSRGRAADYRIELDVLTVTDDVGQPRPYKLSEQGKNLRIRIGDPHRTITGQHEYWITYRVRRAISYFEDHDELYWNVTSLGWPVPIDAAAAVLQMPESLGSGELKLACFTGAFGSRESECSAERHGLEARFVSHRSLDAREGLTVVVGLPKGVLHEPSAMDRFLERASDFLSVWFLLPILALGGMSHLWRTRGRDRSPGTAIPVRYQPPEGLSPAELGTLIDESADITDVTSTILNLAVKGYLRIEELPTSKFLFFSTKDYRLVRLRDPDDLKGHEYLMLSNLFSGREAIKVSELREKFYKTLPAIREALYSQLTQDLGYFPVAPHRVKRAYAWGGGIVLGLGFLLGQFGLVSLTAAVCVGATGAIILAFSKFMPRKTVRGRRAYEEALGFKEFVERVDSDRLERMGTRTVEQFESLLPYAIVLGAADAWANAFVGIYSEPPTWYHGSHHDSGFHPRMFVEDLGQALNTMGQSMSETPDSGGSGSSGFGGGGFSGGGFGGGGGGSW